MGILLRNSESHLQNEVSYKKKRVEQERTFTLDYVVAPSLGRTLAQIQFQRL